MHVYCTIDTKIHLQTKFEQVLSSVKVCAKIAQVVCEYVYAACCIVRIRSTVLVPYLAAFIVLIRSLELILAELDICFFAICCATAVWGNSLLVTCW